MYDLILGRDLLRELKISFDYSKEKVIWDGIELPMLKTEQALREVDLNSLEEELAESEATRDAARRFNKILDAKYEAPDIDVEIDKMLYLNKVQRMLLKQLIKKHESLFDGSLGNWKGDPIDIKLKEGFKPYYQSPIKIAHIHQATFKKDLERLVEVGVLTRINDSEWGGHLLL